MGTGTLLGASFQVVARRRPVDLVAPGFVQVDLPGPGSGPLPQPAPYAAVEVDLAATEPVHVRFWSGQVTLLGEYDARTGRFALGVDDGRRSSQHRSRRHGRTTAPVDRVALTLTGTHLTLFGREDGRWTARGRVELRGRVATRDPGWLAGLAVAAEGPVARLRAGGFGQLGLRDLRLATEADGTPIRDDGLLWLTATQAGPGFFDTAHTGVWSLDPASAELRHTGDLFVRRPRDRHRTADADPDHDKAASADGADPADSDPGDRALGKEATGERVYGDHATHLLRDEGRWLVATSTWGDFRPGPDATVSVVLAESATDPRFGRRVLDTTWLDLPTGPWPSAGVWDPHLVRDGDGWLVGYVSARKFFRFHPVVAAGPDLTDLRVLGAATDRLATEGTTLVRDGDRWWVLASDGRDGRRGQRRRYPVLDLRCAEVGALDAPYHSNLPWPTLARTGDGWLMVGFDGTPAGGPLLGYGTHGDVVVAAARTSAPPTASDQVNDQTSRSTP